jgi:predicted AlkP superfamily phosphohydrolase/phosphomutase
MLVAAGLATLGCRAPEPAAARLVVIGIDGGEWRVVRRLWERGELPHLRALAARGTSATLATAYNSSPVIWTTIATGVRPEQHGITDFVVPTPQGDVPISSTVRKVPALWNMATRAARRVAVLGWWGSWPAEEVNGVVWSDRVLLGLEQEVSPAEQRDVLREVAAEVAREPGRFRLDREPERRDAVMARAAARMLRDPYDLILLYFRSTDIVSHNSWHGWEPEAFPAVEAAAAAAAHGEVERIYGAVDQALGRLLAAAPANTDFLVVSDHGFRAEPKGKSKVLVDFDAVLARFGHLARGAGGGIDFASTRVYTYASADFQPKFVRYSLAGREPRGQVREEEREEVRRRLETDLETVRYAGGEPVFLVRDARRREREEGADFVVVVRRQGATQRVLVAGQTDDQLIASVHRITGNHGAHNHGLLIAAGPRIAAGARVEGIHIHDLGPTILYGLGLPVAADFAGTARRDLFAYEFRQSNALRSIATWGTRAAAGPSTSTADGKLMGELRALGYVN